MIGTGPLKLEMEAQIKELNLEQRVTILNNASDQMVEKKLLSSFALLHPSKREGYGLAILEAASRGVPAIMISYPENRAIELEILTELVSESEKPKELVALLVHTYMHQEQIRKKLKKLIVKNSNNSNAYKSITNIEKIILDFYKPIDYL